MNYDKMVTGLLVVPAKKPYEVDTVKPLKNLIQSSYSAASEKTAEYAELATEFGKLRSGAIFKVFEKYDSSLPVIYK